MFETPLNEDELIHRATVAFLPGSHSHRPPFNHKTLRHMGRPSRLPSMSVGKVVSDHFLFERAEFRQAPSVTVVNE
jgi:hypothetical protein